MMSAKTARETAGIITVAKIRSAGSGTWLTEKWPKGEGTFQIRKLAGNACVYYYRYTDSTARQQRIALPRYNEQGQPVSLAEARADAKALARRYMMGEKDLKEILEYEQLQKEQERLAAIAKEKERQARQHATLGKLMDAYCTFLEVQGKPSAQSTRKAVALHIQKPFPALWEKPAADIQPTDLMPILQRLVKSGKERTANKVRSYIRAAYSAACSAPLNAKAPESLVALAITVNPARDLGVVQSANRVCEETLTLEQLRALWRRIETNNSTGAAILRFYLLTGGQRLRQLRRTTLDDIVDGSLVIQDYKGRRQTPRRHHVPLLPEAEAAIKAIVPHRIGNHILSVNGGASAADEGVISGHTRKIVAQMVEAGEVEKSFSFAVLRRTIETRLAAVGVSSDIRAQLQSHGLGGVQIRHYDRHDYLEEKRLALEKLRDLMSGKLAPVTYLSRKASQLPNDTDEIQDTKASYVCG